MDSVENLGPSSPSQWIEAVAEDEQTQATGRALSRLSVAGLAIASLISCMCEPILGSTVTSG